MTESQAITGGHGIHTSRIGDTWVVSLDPSVLPGPAAAVTPIDVDENNLADLTCTGEHSELADSASWDHENVQAQDGFKVTIQTGEAYNHEGDRTLYAFVRDFTFNAYGQLIAVSAERRVVVETPEAYS